HYIDTAPLEPILRRWLPSTAGGHLDTETEKGTS
ncbi:MAG: hypothetical protein K0R01_3805, partial [Mycobacterium sp.]|nr:hypothetical protein [Mycobacterium sp.]